MIARWIRRIFWLSLMIVIGLALLWILFPLMVDTATHHWMEKQGIQHVAFRITHLDDERLVVEGIKVGEAETLALARAEVTYTLGELRRGRVDTITLEGLRVHGAFKGHRLSLDELDALLPPPSDASPTAIPFRRLTLLSPSLSLAMEEDKMLEARADKIEVTAETALTQLAFENAYLKHGEQEFSGIQTHVALSSLSPPTTLPRQTLTARFIAVGTTLTNLKAAFTLAPDGWLTIHQAQGEWGGGTLLAEDATLNIHGTGKQTVTLLARGVNLQEVVGLAGMAGLSTTGKVQGRVPLEIDHGTVRILRGNLSTVAGGGVLVYKPEAGAALTAGATEQSDLLLKAVENFHYKVLSLDLHSEAPNTLRVRVELRGSNPDLYDGKAINLNINLQGDLIEIIKTTLNLYDIPSRLEDALHERPQ